MDLIFQRPGEIKMKTGNREDFSLKLLERKLIEWETENPLMLCMGSCGNKACLYVHGRYSIKNDRYYTCKHTQIYTHIDRETGRQRQRDRMRGETDKETETGREGRWREGGRGRDRERPREGGREGKKKRRREGELYRKQNKIRQKPLF